MQKLAPALRSAGRALPFVAALLLAACKMPSGAPGADSGASDPALQDHARWCNTNPPSGYCDVDDHR